VTGISTQSTTGTYHQQLTINKRTQNIQPNETKSYLPQQQHDETEQKDAYDDADNDNDNDDPECQADWPLNLNVRNDGCHCLHEQKHNLQTVN